MEKVPKQPEQVIQCLYAEGQGSAGKVLRSCFDSASESNWVLNLSHLQNWFNDQAGSIEVVNRSPINMKTLGYGLHQWAHDVTEVCGMPLQDSVMLVSSLFQMGFMTGFYSRQKEDTEKPQ